MTQAGWKVTLEGILGGFRQTKCDSAKQCT
jgi:hypothetical protein